MNHRSSISALTNKTGCLIVTDSDKANMFNQYFSSVADIDNGVVPTRVNTANACSELDCVTYTKNAVCKAKTKI